MILLLISPDFIYSDYCYRNEMEKAIKRHEYEEACIIPIIIRPCMWTDTPLSSLLALPKDGLAVTSWTNEDEAFLNICKGIKKAAEEIKAKPGISSGINFNENVRENFKKEQQIKVNDFVEFGSYWDDPILWKCVKKESDSSIMLVSEYILCLKAFDSAEGGKYYQGRDDVQKYGSSKWVNSNIREWLNSDNNRVSYSTQPPVTEAIPDGYNAYVDEPGFLSNFNVEEKGLIKIVNHEDVTDKVFLLSKGELALVGDTDNARAKNATRKAAEKSEYKVRGLKPNEAWWYWIRTPWSLFSVQVVTYNGRLDHFNARSGIGGALPALYLRTDICKSGKGTKDEPWRMV